jgi:hypothetical protein
MKENSKKFKNRSTNFSEGSRFGISTKYHLPEGQQELRGSDALRTYATWLVRATRRKVAISGPENTPKKNPN